MDPRNCRREAKALCEVAKATHLLVGGEDGHVNLVGRELRQEVRIFGKGLELDASSIRVHSQELRSVSREGDPLDFVAVHELEFIF